MAAVMYFANPAGDAVTYMRAGDLGFIDTPDQGSLRPTGVTFCLDNGCFSDRFNEVKWWAWLQKNAPYAADCRFATAPDIVGDHAATVVRSTPWLPKIRALGFPAAFVAQDGAAVDTVPWDDFDVLFIGGTTEWKLGEHARDLVGHAKSRGMWVHMGRVNSLKRYRYADSIGCDSADGTFLVFGPDRNLPELLHWVRTVNNQLTLGDM